MTDSPVKPQQDDLDPLFVHARREALIVLVVWVIGLTWTVGYCLATGYDIPPEQIHSTLGVPNWIFYGVLLPWLAIIAFSIWFGLFYIADDQLTHEQGQSQRRNCNNPQNKIDEASQ